MVSEDLGSDPVLLQMWEFVWIDLTVVCVLTSCDRVVFRFVSCVCMCVHVRTEGFSRTLWQREVRNKGWDSAAAAVAM